MIEVSGTTMDWALAVVSVLFGLLVSGGRPSPALIRFIQWVKTRLGLSGSWAAALKWGVSAVLALLVMFINRDLLPPDGIVTPTVFLALISTFQKNLQDWYEKLRDSGAFNTTLGE